MGRYIEVQGGLFDKAQSIVNEYNGKICDQPMFLSDVPDDKALICVVKNPYFEAAGYAFNEREFLTFIDPTDARPRTWLLMDKKKANELTGYNG